MGNEEDDGYHFESPYNPVNVNQQFMFGDNNFVTSDHIYCENNSNCNYDSDRIDSDIEEMLYTSIHHQTIDSQELSFSVMNNKDSNEVCNSVGVNGSSDINDSCNDNNNNLFSSSTPKSISMVNKRKVIKKEKTKLKKQQRFETKKISKAITYSRKIVPSGSRSLITNVDQEKSNLSFNGIIPLNISYGNNICLDEIDLTEHMNKFYNEDNYDSEEEKKMIKKMPKDTRYWKVNKEDLWLAYGGRNSKSRRFRQCRICFDLGHVDRDCPQKVKVCYICGQKNHQVSTCKQKLCSICFAPGHMSDKCKLKYNTSPTCSICKQSGHSSNQCTFHWRKCLTITNEQDYHRLSKSNIIRPDEVTFNRIISCYNCGMQGSHFAFECTSLTINRKRFEIPSPILNFKRKKSSSQTKSASKSPRNGIVSNFSANKHRSNRDNSLGSSQENPIEIDSSDDSIDYVLNIPKQSAGSPSHNGSYQTKKKSVKRKKKSQRPDRSLSISQHSKSSSKRIRSKPKPNKNNTNMSPHSSTTNRKSNCKKRKKKNKLN